jgi:hypothetical protein
MGKSLSILALVTKTLDSAEVWQHGEGEDHGVDDLPHLTRSRATLIFVPSGCA